VSDYLYFQAGTAELVQVRLYDNESKANIARKWMYPLHRGTLYGIPTKILALIAALVAFTLPISGFMIWMGRKKKKKKPELKAKAVKSQALPLDKHPDTSVQYQ
jgi:uncharacterized iron-regulated membrane protein